MGKSKKDSIYSKLIKLYPKKYKEKYGDQIIQTTEDMLNNTTGQYSKILIWIKVFFDLPFNILKQHILNINYILANETPSYIRQTSIVSNIFILPFLILLIINELDIIIHGSNLYSSWFWRMPILGIWVLWMPAVSFATTVISYLTYIFKNGIDGMLKNIFYIRQTWIVLIPAFLAFGILFMLAFHDSTHCVVQHPYFIFTKFHQTMQCISNGFLGGK